jgi:xylan 1,4-beta-xylosidase
LGAKSRLLCILLVGVLCATAQQSSVELNIDVSEPGEPLQIERIALGQGGLSSDPIWADRMPEIRTLHPRVIRLFLQDYFGVMPETGQYDWHKLDPAVDLIRQTGATPLMTIAFKPKPLFPKIDEAITDPTDYAAWEDLISAMVRHYKERGSGIIYWEVANEPDIGERGGCPYLFTPEGYVRYYRHTAAAIRRADPAAKVGGPALANPDSPILPALLASAQSDHLPLDFISWHIYNSDPLKIRATIDRKKELLKQFPAVQPETFLDEWNMALQHPPNDPQFQSAFIAETAWQMKDAGLDYSCYYHIRDYHVLPEVFAKFISPRGNAAMTKWWNRMPQYDGLFDFQNQVRPSYFAFQLLARLTGRRLPVKSSSNTIHGFATYDEFLHTYNILFWNFSDQPARVNLTIKGLPTGLKAEHLFLDATAPSSDENSRLRPLPTARVEAGQSIPVDLPPYGVTFWSIDLP